jgi:hypothetical protein
VAGKPSYLAPVRYDTRRPNRDHVFNAAARERGNHARGDHMVERRAGWIERCRLGGALETATSCRHYRASAVAPGRKWPCRDDRLRSAGFGYGGGDAAAERNLANGIAYQN